MNREQMYARGLESLAKQCNTSLDPDWAIPAYMSVFKDIGYDKGCDALKLAFMKARGHGQMPSPADLLELVGHKLPEPPTLRDQANEIASAVIKAVSDYGSYQSNAARARLGPFAWDIVEAYGGWDTVCNMEHEDEGMHRAQLRDLAESRQRISAHKTFQEKIGSSGKNLKLVEGIVGELQQRTKA